MRKIVLYGIIIFQILLIISLVRGIQLSRRSIARIAGLEETKQKLLDEQEKLKKEEEYVASPYYLEKVARDELGLAKPGERVVIIPTNQQTNVTTKTEKSEDVEKPNWQKWWEVLSGT